MILNRSFYNKTSLIKSWWNAYRMRKLAGERVYKIFRLHKTILPEKTYFYSPRLKRKPRFSGDLKLLSSWKDSKLCENMCPTNAIRVTSNDVVIDDQGCITCGLCVEISPYGLLVMSSELNLTRP